jgi:hypothetical protein
MAKANTQKARLEKFWEDEGIELSEFGLPPLAGAEEGLKLAGVTADVSYPGAGELGQDVFDLYPQAALTDITLRSLETAWETIPHIGAEIAPLKPVYDRKIRRDIAEVAPFGIGQFRAPDATPSIYNPNINYVEEVQELLLLDEMTEIKEDLWIRMTSDVPSIRARAGVDLATLGKILQLRHERLTEVMRWQVFKGQPIVVNFSGGQKQEIKPSYLETHKPSAAVPWTDRINSTPIDDMRGWQKIIGNDAGVYGSRFHMNSQTYEKLQRSNQARGYLTQTDRNTFLPTVEDICTLLWGSTPSDAQGGVAAEAPMIIVTDSGYRAETGAVAGEGLTGYNRGQSSITNFLQNGEILLTTSYVFEGENIADVPDGPVLVSDTWNSLKKMIGAQSELIVNRNNYNTFMRQGCSRFVRMRRPQSFLLGKAF